MVGVSVKGGLCAVILHHPITVALPLSAKDSTAAPPTHPLAEGQALPMLVVAA